MKPRWSLYLWSIAIAGAVGLAALWIWAAGMERRAAQERETLQREVSMAERALRKQYLVEQINNLKQSPEIQPVPALLPLPESTAQWAAWQQRVEEQLRYGRIGDAAQLALTYWICGGMIALGTGGLIQRRLRNKFDRPTDEGAGQVIAALSRQGGPLVSRVGAGRNAQDIVVDPARHTAVFRNFCFVAKFVGNAPSPEVELKFSEILVVDRYLARGQRSLVLRTTQGRVTILGDQPHFDQLHALFADMVEVNRESPQAYAKARAREPVIRTPWWGWAIIATMTALVAGLCWWMWEHA